MGRHTPQPPIPSADKNDQIKPEDIGARGSREWSKQNPDGSQASKGTRRG